MRLHKAVELRNLLSGLSVSPTLKELDDLDLQIKKGLSISGDLPPETFAELLSLMASSNEKINGVQQAIASVTEILNQLICTMTEPYLARGYVINGIYPGASTTPDDERKNRILPMDEVLRPVISAKIKRYTDWHYPALEIGPGLGSWTGDLVAADPLYIIDHHQENIDATMSQFNSIYQNRLRKYLTRPVSDVRSIEDTDLSELPQGQFGFIFSWNLFNYLPLSHIKSYLEQCFGLLKPGGVMMFSYNDAENVQCAEYVEQGLRSWMPKSLLIKTFSDIGYLPISLNSYSDDIHIVEIAKPGQLSSIRAHQTLGEILPINS